LHFRREVEAEKEEPEENACETELRSVTNKDFGIDDFIPMKPAATAVRVFASILFITAGPM